MKGVKIKKINDPEKAVKVGFILHSFGVQSLLNISQEKERLEKKAAKAEKEKKEKDAQDKSRSLMANFFGKSKVPTRAPLKEADSADAGPSRIQSDFERIFKSFVIKKDTQLAPINWFSESKKWMGNPLSGRIHDDVIVIDEDSPRNVFDVEMDGGSASEEDVSCLSCQGWYLYALPSKVVHDLHPVDHVRAILSSLPRPARRRLFSKHISHLKTYNPLSVRDIVSQLSEAEVAGDIPLVRSLLSKLLNRSLLPAKVFIFNEDARPGYFGTWTRNSRIIGPRSPFAKDVLVFDYNYDSGEEWEQEIPGDADDVVDDGEDEEDEGDAPDSDLDSWLVDDDEEPVSEVVDMPLVIPDLSAQSMKRKAEDSDKKTVKRRKVVLPLLPFAKGPCWESPIGHCEHNLLKPYLIQVFNGEQLLHSS
jgi:chromatin assembly factor 1 subunit A